MADESFAEREIVINSYSNIAQSFFVEDMVITQPTGRETLLSQIELWERTPCVVEYPLVEYYIYRKQFEEENDLDDICLGE